jgi:hypothetical protein
VTFLVEVTVETIDFVATLGKAILTNNLSAALQALEDYGNFVWQGIVSVAASAAEFYEQMSNYLVNLALTALEVLIEKLKEIGEMILDGLMWFVNFILGLVEQAVNIIFKPLIDFLEDYGNELGQAAQNVIDAFESGKGEGAAIFGFLGTLAKGFIMFSILAGLAIVIFALLTLGKCLGIGAIIMALVTTVIIGAIASIVESYVEKALTGFVDFIQWMAGVPLLGGGSTLLVAIYGLASYLTAWTSKPARNPSYARAGGLPKTFDFGIGAFVLSAISLFLIVVQFLIKDDVNVSILFILDIPILLFAIRGLMGSLKAGGPHQTELKLFSIASLVTSAISFTGHLFTSLEEG